MPNRLTPSGITAENAARKIIGLLSEKSKISIIPEQMSRKTFKKSTNDFFHRFCLIFLIE